MLSIRSKALTHVAERLTSQQEDERRRIGAELHDQLGQDMTAIATRLRVLMRTRENPALVDSGLLAIQELVDDAHTHLRDVIHQLHPLALDRFGLSRALAEGPLAAMARDAGVDYRCDIGGDVDSLPPPIATALYRICQEAATNCVRHGCGGRIEICLWLTPTGVYDELVLKIEDDAGEIELGTERQGHGLQGIRDRANAIGADYYFHRDSGHPRHWLQLRVYKAETRA
jgi:two-component system sensor histidine kinase UhpB